MAEETIRRNLSRLGNAIRAEQKAFKVHKIMNDIRSDTNIQAVGLPIVVESPEYNTNTCAVQRDNVRDAQSWNYEKN